VAAYTSDTIGSTSDEVRLVVNGKDILIAESWDIHEGILEQPMAWSLRMGSGQTAGQILQLAPKNTPFQLYVAGALQATGKTEGVTAAGSATTPTQVVIKGRDPLCELYTGHVVAPQSFINSTYLNLVWRALLAVGLVTGTTPDPTQLASTNEANRQIKAGKKITQLAAPKPVDQVVQDEDSGTTDTATSYSEIQAKLGENWLHFVRRYLDTAGLVLWAAADGTFILSEPNVNQAPLYQIIRRASLNPTQRYGNVTSYNFVDDATHRHSYAVAYARGGGRKAGRQKSFGDEVDDEMFNLGFTRQIAFRESSAQNREQCENYCERKLAEERREGYQLHYVVAGHTLPLLGGGPTNTAVITPDTVVQVTDEELGINATPFYIESVRRMRSPQTQTEIRLMRPADIVLGAD
jgi:prophage tail gpP-like protein